MSLVIWQNELDFWPIHCKNVFPIIGFNFLRTAHNKGDNDSIINLTQKFLTNKFILKIATDLVWHDLDINLISTY